jgi:hypothetical protein
MKPRHRAGKDRVHAAAVHPSPPNALNTRVVRFRVAVAILFDRQLLPLTTQIQDLQNVVEDLAKAQLRRRAAATDGELRQDKLLELRRLQLRRKRLPPLSFRHSGPPKNPALPDSVASAEIPGQRPLKVKFNRLQKPATSCRRAASQQCGGGDPLGELGEMGHIGELRAPHDLETNPPSLPCPA